MFIEMLPKGITFMFIFHVYNKGRDVRAMLARSTIFDMGESFCVC